MNIKWIIILVIDIDKANKMKRSSGVNVIVWVF